MHNGLKPQFVPFEGLSHDRRGVALSPDRVTSPAFGGQSDPKGGAASGEAAGLVQYKTSPHLEQVISFAKPIVRERRLKRLKRNVYLTGQLHSIPKPGFRPDDAWLITPTYDTRGTLGRGAHNWCPDQISDATNRYRRWCKNHGYSAKYTWVAELTAKGTVHYHLVAWLPVGVRMPQWDKPNGKRRAFWPHGMTETAKLKTNCSYLMKYLSKMGEFHDFPPGLRLNGNGGLDANARSIRSWHNLPSWVRTMYGVGELARCAKGHIDLSTGEILEPLYSRRFIPGGLVLTAKREPPVPWQTSASEPFFGPYCSWSREMYSNRVQNVQR
jgi:hypothetical protein